MTSGRATSLAATLVALPILAAAAPDERCPGPSLGSDAPEPANAPWADRSRDPADRAALLVSEMTLEEQADLATGERCLLYGYFDAPVERLGIPALTMTDGPAGIRIPYGRVNGGRATSLPAPLAVAASWDESIAELQGDVLGAEAFATGHNVLLGPTLDLARSPLAGRNFEGFGEDPLLAARMAVPMVRAIQRHPVIATAKHFAVYTQEADRFSVDARVDDRTLHELYLRPFAAAVRDGGAGAVMCGFNRVNGVLACENPALLRDLLQGELGFEGFVVSDWSAISSTESAALAGLDLEMAFGKYFGRALVDAVRAGVVPQAVLHDKARRILRSMFRVGLLDQPVVEGPLPADASARSARIGEAGAVLLKNAGGLLPLAPDTVRSIAVIGPDAANASTQGGGAARVEPAHSVSPLDGIAARAGAGVRVAFAEGGDPVNAAHLLPGRIAIPSAVLAPRGGAPGAHGLRAEYWFDGRFEGEPDLVRTERQIALSMGFFAYQSVNASSVQQLPDKHSLSRFAARWTGTLTPTTSGDHVIELTSRGRGRVWVDGALVVDDWDRHRLGSSAATVRLAGGTPHELRVDYVADAPELGTEIDVGGDVRLGWEAPGGEMPAVREAAALAASSDVAVVLVRDYGTEERDRLELSLPNGQDALVSAVAAVNPRTVVVLMTGQPVSMPWLDAIPALVEAWYPGQEQGDVIARVLFGDVNPSGKLPITFPRQLQDAPPAGAGARDAIGPRLDFAERSLIGYRWYDARGIEPLFPFGHGLSYTSFAYDGLEVRPGANAVAFTLTNSGARAGAEVAQVYVGSCPGDELGVPRRLAGFAKVALEPGASRRVVVDLSPESLGAWDSSSRSWKPPDCVLPVSVGASSRDVRLSGRLTDAVVPVVVATPTRKDTSGGCSTAAEAGTPSAAGAAWVLAAPLLLLALRRRIVRQALPALAARPAKSSSGDGSGVQAPSPQRTREVQRDRPAPALADPCAGAHLLDEGEGAMVDARIVETGGALVVTLVTRWLDCETAPQLCNLLAERARGRALVVVSLEHVGGIDCSGLAALVVLLKRMAPGGELRLAGAKPQARALLAATRLDELFPHFADVDAALSPPTAEAASP